MGVSNYVKSVMVYLKGGDEAKLARLQKKYQESNQEQIDQRIKEVQKIKSRLEDNDEALKESILNVNLDAIKTIDYTEQYIENIYRPKHTSIMLEKRVLEFEIERLEEEIEVFLELNKTVSEINLSESK